MCSGYKGDLDGLLLLALSKRLMMMIDDDDDDYDDADDDDDDDDDNDLAKSSLRSLINSSAVHWADKTVNPQMSANKMLT